MRSQRGSKRARKAPTASTLSDRSSLWLLDALSVSIFFSCSAALAGTRAGIAREAKASPAAAAAVAVLPRKPEEKTRMTSQTRRKGLALARKSSMLAGVRLRGAIFCFGGCFCCFGGGRRWRRKRSGVEFFFWSSLSHLDLRRFAIAEKEVSRARCCLFTNWIDGLGSLEVAVSNRRGKKGGEESRQERNEE